MSPATGMAFMLAGSVTSIPAAIAIWSLARMRLFALYAAVGGIRALMAAASWQAVLRAARGDDRISPCVSLPGR